MRGLSAGISVVPLAMLCQCSLLFDVGGLDNGSDGGTDARSLGPLDGNEADAAAADASDDGAGGGGEFDTAEGGPADGGGADATDARRADAGAPDSPGIDGPDSAGPDDAASEGPASDGADGAGPDASSPDASDAGGDLSVGLVAYYPFDETSGTTSADATGNGHTAMMQGATFAGGLRGNAATLSGTNQCVSLPSGIVSGLSAFSISAWVIADNTVAHTRIFDFGTGTTAYMFLTPHTTVARFAITTSGANAEQRVDAPVLAVASWQHVAVVLSGTTDTLYVNGVQVAQNTGVTLNPASLGTTTQNWLGRSQFVADPYLTGQIDNFRIYDRALSTSEVQQLFQQRL